MTPDQVSALIGNDGAKKYDAAKFGRNFLLQREVIDLSVARDNVLLDVAGEFIYFDKNTSGDLDIRINYDRNPPMPVGANFAIKDHPYGELYLTNAAQAGLIANLWYGFDATIIPPNQDISNINNIVNVANIANITPPSHVTSFRYIGADATLKTIVTPVANTSGVKVFGAGVHINGTGSEGIVGHKSSAPASVDDTAVAILAEDRENGSGKACVQTSFPVIVKAGQGLYAQKTGTNANEAMWCNYEVLP